MQLKEAIQSRKSTKKFNGKEVDWKKIIQAIDMARYSPMAGNMFSLKFILVQNQDKIKKIVEATQQDFLYDCTSMIVVVSDRQKVEKMYDYNQKGFAQQQAGAAIQNILLSLTEKKIEHCWIGFFQDKLIKNIISIPDNLEIEAIIAMGIPAKIKTPEKQKPELENIIFFDKYGKRKMEQETRVRHEWN